ncbi:MAG: PIN domain-containing protein [Planctomycetota bacterium]|jgi:hypothetical protein|nr:PIN domain-containing protein [Planctomycetota bacterium]MDP7131969.1 PIN domain-containing protein [Planctomycetota bacterium]MDP7253623.1 PIN domain-containing protein [Planctomycetota bacterium]
MVFVDTGAWFALAVKEDADHEPAKEWLAGSLEPLLTTDYVIVETINLLRFRDKTDRGHSVACEWADKLWSGELALVRPTNTAIRDRAVEIFKSYDDKIFSFTDCSSFALMELEEVSVAFAFDHHFDQFPGIIRVP